MNNSEIQDSSDPQDAGQASPQATTRPADVETDMWGLEDYAIWVPMTDEFYKTLNFVRTTEEAFRSGTYQHQPHYKDSRTYVLPLIEHYQTHCETPEIFDVGGYIGRFSIETGIGCRDRYDVPITIFEPGETLPLLEGNLALNGLEDIVTLARCAVADKQETKHFAIPRNAKISSRLVDYNPERDGPEYKKGWDVKAVSSEPLSNFMSAADKPFICKIDTEGHEVNVIKGITQANLSRPHSLVVEFWPKILDETIFDQDVKSFLQDNYLIFNILSSLYPRGFTYLEDFDSVSDQIKSGELTNIDLLLISKNTPELDTLVSQLRELIA